MVDFNLSEKKPSKFHECLMSFSKQVFILSLTSWGAWHGFPPAQSSLSEVFILLDSLLYTIFYKVSLYPVV